jgi:hypothetical protein
MTKTYSEFVSEDGAIANSVGDGTGIANYEKPLSSSPIKRSPFMGRTVMEVDHDTYCRCIKGRDHGSRWDKFIENEDIRSTLRKEYQKGKPLFVQSEYTKSLTYLRQ